MSKQLIELNLKAKLDEARDLRDRICSVSGEICLDLLSSNYNSDSKKYRLLLKVRQLLEEAADEMCAVCMELLNNPNEGRK